MKFTGSYLRRGRDQGPLGEVTESGSSGVRRIGRSVPHHERDQANELLVFELNAVLDGMEHDRAELRGQFSKAQRDTLLQPIKPYRVSKDGKGFSHVEAYEIKAHLNRLFGFEGWSTEVRALDCIFETETDGKWTACYLCTMTLVICEADGTALKRSMDASTGDATNQKSRADAHDLAVKSAVSGALKRCATALGDQFGLVSMHKGSMDALVKRVIPYEEPEAYDHYHIVCPDDPERPPTPCASYHPGWSHEQWVDHIRTNKSPEGLEKAKQALSNG